jgi:hypothetical protein
LEDNSLSYWLDQVYGTSFIAHHLHQKIKIIKRAQIFRFGMFLSVLYILCMGNTDALL